MNQINPEYIIPESFFFVFHVLKTPDNIKRTFQSILQCTEETCRFKLLNLNEIASDDEYASITKYSLTKKLHFDYLLKPTEPTYPLKSYFEAFHLINKF